MIFGSTYDFVRLWCLSCLSCVKDDSLYMMVSRCEVEFFTLLLLSVRMFL